MFASIRLNKGNEYPLQISSVELILNKSVLQNILTYQDGKGIWGMGMTELSEGTQKQPPLESPFSLFLICLYFIKKNKFALRLFGLPIN